MNEGRAGFHNEDGRTYQWMTSVHLYSAFYRDMVAMRVTNQGGCSVDVLLNRAQFHGMTREQYEQAIVFTYVSHVIQNWDNLLQAGKEVELFDIPLKEVQTAEGK